MSTDIERFVEDLGNDENLYAEVADFEGTIDELADWLKTRGYDIEAGPIGAVLTATVEALSDEDLDAVSGGVGRVPRGKLDGMNEMSEMTSLRLQMTMDRRSKFVSTLSAIMKKISSTQDTIVSNVK